MILVNTKERNWHSSRPDLELKIVHSGIEQGAFNVRVEEYTPRVWPAIALAGYKESLTLVSEENKGGFDFSDQCVDGWLALIRKELYANPSVEDIFISIEDSDVDVWVVLPKRDLAILRQLASIEWKMLKIFVSGEHPPFLIDFHVVYRCGRNADDLVPTKTIRLPRQV